MTPFAKLEPISKPGEVLASPCQSRPEIVVNRNDCVTLGRNKTTLVGLDSLSRQLVRLQPSSNNRNLLLKMMKPHHSVHVNHSKVQTNDYVILKSGDILTLSGNDYAYRIHYPLEGAAAATVTDDDDNSQEQPPPPMHESEVAEETTCPICLDILIQSTALACGHVFCQVCLEQHDGNNSNNNRNNNRNNSNRSNNNRIRSCPICRQSGRGAIPLKQMDSLVWKLVKEGKHFERADIETYLERDGRNLSDQERRQIFGEVSDDKSSRKRQRTAAGNGSLVPSQVVSGPPPFERRSNGTNEQEAICIE